jgi:hypothetical protein
MDRPDFKGRTVRLFCVFAFTKQFAAVDKRIAKLA